MFLLWGLVLLKILFESSPIFVVLLPKFSEGLFFKDILLPNSFLKCNFLPSLVSKSSAAFIAAPGLDVSLISSFLGFSGAAVYALFVFF